jgi:hypothetical protein
LSVESSEHEDRSTQALQQLLACEGDTFVEEAYRLLLGREADTEGLAFYRRRLAGGARRQELLAELSRSEEAARMLAEDSALEAALRRLLGLASPGPTTSLATLLSATDADFIDLLCRHLAPGRLGTGERLRLLARLRAGQPRVQLASELADTHGVAASAALPGLDTWIMAYREARAPATAEVAELMALHDDHFVAAAYRCLLGREVDFQGLAHYGGLLDQGASRTSILLELARSSEARGQPPRLPDLAAWLVRQRWWRLPLLRFVAVLLGITESESPRARQARRLAAVSRRVWRLQALDHPGAAGPAAAPQAASGQLQQRHEQLLDIQRDRYERQLQALARQWREQGPGSGTSPRRRSAKGRWTRR